MRIALLSWESLHSIAVGGVAQHVTELAAGLERNGHEVHVFTRMAPGQRLHDWIDGVHYHRCPYAFHPEFVEDVNNMCRSFVDRVFLIEDYVGPFDVIHAHDWLAANAMIWIKQGRGRKCVLTIHSTEYARCGNTFPGGRSHRVRSQERAGTYWADRVIAVSHATKKEIVWMYEVPEWKIDVVYNGVSPHRFDVDIDPGQAKQRYGIGPLDPTVLFCGRLAHQKGPDFLLEAVPAILKHHGHAKFVFAGDGEMRGQLEARARRLGVMHAVRFLGCRNGAELVGLFKMADLVCVPSRNEPFGIVVLEAWSARKPVVVTQNGGPNEYVRHEVDGLKIYANPDSVAWGIGTLFADFDRARWMGRNGRQAVDARFTWDVITAETLRVYDPNYVEPRERQRADETVTAPLVLRLPDVALACADLEEHRLGRAVAQVPLLAGHARVRRSDVIAACRQVGAEPSIEVRVNGEWAEIRGDVDRVFGAVRRYCQLVGGMVETEMTTTISLLKPSVGEQGVGIGLESQKVGGNGDGHEPADVSPGHSEARARPSEPRPARAAAVVPAAGEGREVCV